MGRRGRPKKTEGSGEEEQSEKMPVEAESTGIQSEQAQVEVTPKGAAVIPLMVPPVTVGDAQTQTTPIALTESSAKKLWADEVETLDPVAPIADPVPNPRNWAEVVRGIRDVGNGWVLHYYPPDRQTKTVIIPPEEKDEDVAVWKSALIGFVPGAKPRFKEMESFARNKWRGIGAPIVHMLREGIFLFDFLDVDAKERALDRNWSYRRQPLILRPWSPSLDLTKLDVEEVPVWVQFPDLPLSCWTPSILGRIASYIGQPLATDKLTAGRERLQYARVLINVKVGDNLVWDVPVSEEQGSFKQRVVYE